MNSMRTILVTGASGIVGYGCLKSLRTLENCRLIGTSMYDSLIAKKFSDLFLIAPHTNDSGYLEWLVDTIKKHHVDVLIPGIEIDMYKWNENRDVLEKEGVKLILNRKELIDLCGDKWEFFLKLNQELPELAIPTYMEQDYEQIVSTVGIPFVLKTRNGYGSRGVKLIHNELEYRYYRKMFGETAMAQKFIEGEEYTVGTMFDECSELCAYICMRRKLSSIGYTEEAEVVNIPEVKKMVCNLGKIFQPIGATNFQFIKEKEKFRLLEINPRISSSNYIRTQFGFNECKMNVEYILANKLPTQPIIKKGKAIRYVEEVIQYDGDNI